VLVCGGRTGRSVRAFTAVRALTKESVIRSTIAVISSVFISVDADGTTVVVGIAVAVDGGGAAGVPCKAYRAASWTSPKS
jgi:spore maturation protein SpmB